MFIKYDNLKLFNGRKLDIINEIRVKRKEEIDIETTIRNKKPSKSQIRETLTLLSDFQIKDIKVPEFDTYSDMLRWRKKIILNSLNKRSYSNEDK